MAHDFDRYPELTNSQFRFYYFDSPHQQITANFEAEVINVHDGDTVTLRTEFRDFDFPLRMSFNAAPELDEQGGEESRKWLEEQVMGETVDILIDRDNRVGKWGRLLGEILFRGMNMNDLSKRNGFATEFR